MSEVPEKLGKYHILELIAQGGMAQVYKAKTVGIAGFEKILALKRIRPRYINEPRFIRNFIDEARIAVSLNHRNIVQVFDFGKAEGELFLAMELLEGVDLRTAVHAARKRGEQLPPALACYILAEVAVGLDYAHRKCDREGNNLGIVHCDVSPHNVLLSHEGFIKILDFGVARAKFVAAPTSKRLRGKPRYMSPEQTLGDTPTAASDVFVVGVLAWELLVGRQLFDGKDVRTILKAVREAEILDISRLAPQLPVYLCEAVMRALHRDPLQRGSASEIGGHLARAGRELHVESSAQALTDWLERMFAQDFLPEETLTDLPAAPPLALVLEDEPTAPSTSQEHSGEKSTTSTHSIGDVPPFLEALIDKRRVVVSILLLSGGVPERRHQLSKILCDLAYKRGAVIHQSGDSEVVAIFGLEVAGEDDVGSAMHFALDASELARETSSEPSHAHGEHIALRSAARAGVVAQRKERGYQLRGDALREARELARGAESGRPLLSGGAGRLVSAQFRFRELPARRYRSRRLRVLELIGPSGHEDRARALRSRQGRYVGRSQELESLWSNYQECVRCNRLSGLWVCGSAGTGKSRLVAEFVARLDASQADVLLFAVAATEHAVDAPFTVALNYMQAALSLAPGRGEMARALMTQRLSKILRDAGYSESQVVDACHTIEVAMELRDGALSGNQEAPSALRKRCNEAIVMTHRALSAGRPSVLVLENFHLADAASLEVLRLSLEGESCDGATMVLMTCRDGSLLSDVFPSVASVALTDLDQKQRSELIRDRLADAYTEELVEDVARRSGGNPLFIEALCRNIREVGWDETPATIHDTVVSRIDRLTERSRAALQRAAVIGESFRARILEELIAGSASDSLQELVEEGLLVRADAGEFEAEGGVFNFPHGIIQEVVYASLSAGARASTHAKLGRLLASRDEAGRNEPPVLTARHLELGGLAFDSAAYWTKAGRVALAAFETRAASDAFTRAIEIHVALSPDLKKQCHAQRVEALFGRSRANRDLENYDEEGADLHELSLLVYEDLPAQSELLIRTSGRHLRNGAFQAALQAAQDAEALAKEAENPLLEAEALRISGEVYERRGSFDQGIALFDQALRLFETLEARAHATRARISMARSHLIRGNYSEALTIYQPILADVIQSRDPWVERITNNHLAIIYLCLGDFETAMQHALASVEACQADSDRARLADNLSVCGTVLSQVGRYEEATEYFTRSSALLGVSKSRWSAADCRIYQGITLGKQGDLPQAFRLVESAYQDAKELEAPYVECKAAIALAGLYLLRHRSRDLESAKTMAQYAVQMALNKGVVGGRILALSRQASAMRLLGESQEGISLSLSAIGLLEEQRHIEGAEEEILYEHYLQLRASDSPDANDYLRRAKQSIEHKLASITNVEWRRSYLEEVPLNIEILQAAEGLDQ